MQINPTAQRTLADRPSMPEAYRLVLRCFSGGDLMHTSDVRSTPVLGNEDIADLYGAPAHIALKQRSSWFEQRSSL
jgi:hypothetical protein